MQNRPSTVSCASVEANLILGTLMIHGVDFQCYAIGWELTAGAGRIGVFPGTPTESRTEATQFLSDLCCESVDLR
jgi:hypothetical protein